MKKKVILIEVAGQESNIFVNYMGFPLLGPLYLGTILHNAGFDVKILNENVLKRRLSPLELEADFICITCLTLNSSRSKELAYAIKSTWPDTKIFLGGIHPSLLPEEFIGLADHIVIGEGEEVILDLINGKYSQKIIQGTRIANLDDLPVVNYSLLENYEAIKIIPIMTSRGCPFNCNFCTVTKVFGKEYRKQSVERIIAEIENAMNYFECNYVFFYDDNFSFDKIRIHKLCDSLIEKKLNIIWTAQVRTDIAKDKDLLQKMSAAGCERFYIGFESINDSVLESLHKSQTRNDIIHAIEKIHQSGINIHGMFMFGDEHDTLENIEDTVDFAIEYDIDTLQFLMLTPFPGTEIYERINSRGGLLHNNWDYYDTMHVVFLPRNMTPVQLQLAGVKAHQKFYSVNSTILKIVHSIFNLSYEAFFWNLNSAARHDFNNLFLKFGAKYIIDNYVNSNQSYLNYLELLSKKNEFLEAEPEKPD